MTAKPRSISATDEQWRELKMFCASIGKPISVYLFELHEAFKKVNK